jgi:hypothetical protein
MTSEPGEYLYHYTTRKAAFEHILPERRLRLSSFDLMGDPQEARKWMLPVVYGRDVDREALSEGFGSTIRLTNEFKRHTKLLALSTDAPHGFEHPAAEPFGKGWARTRMWERYAEAHRGVCLAFRADRLKERVTEQLKAQGAERVLDDRVYYRETGLHGAIHSLSLGLDDFTAEGVERALSDHFDRHGETLFFTKTLEWATEFEYRFVAYTRDSPGYTFVDFDDALAQVFAGDQFPAIEIPGLFAFCEALDVEPRQFRWTDFRRHDFVLTPLGDTTRLRENMEIRRVEARRAGAEPLEQFQSRP